MILFFVRVLHKIGSVCAFVICKCRSWWYTNLYNDGRGRIIIGHPFARIVIRKAPTAKLVIDGALIFRRHLSPYGYLTLDLGSESRMEIENDFIVGENTSFYLYKGASLSIKGKSKESGSGITGHSRIMVYRRIEIGYDFLGAWELFISDSDWHPMGNRCISKDVTIGDHVWIGNNCNILKGTRIGKESIVASCSKLINREFEPRSLIAGNPAHTVKTDIPAWKRDLPQ